MNPELRKLVVDAFERTQEIGAQSSALEEIRAALLVECGSLERRKQAAGKERNDLDAKLRVTESRLEEIESEVVETESEVAILEARARSAQRNLEQMLRATGVVERSLAERRDQGISLRETVQEAVGSVTRIDYKLRHKVVNR